MAAKAHKRPHVQRGHVGVSQLMTVSDATLPIVHFSLTFRHGSLTDTPEAPGALAMLLPWLLRGTRKHSRAAFHEKLEGLGSSVDTSVSHEMASVHGCCLRAQLPETMALVREALHEPLLDEEALEDLREEARQGFIAERDDDDTVAELFLRQAFYDGTPLMHSPLGSHESLSQLPKAAVQAARQHLCASRLTAAFAGDIHFDDAKVLLAPFVDALPSQTPAAPMPVATPRVRQGQPRLLLIDKPDRTQAQVRLAIPGLNAQHPDLDAFWLAVVAFGGTFTSPLTREVRDKRGWSYVAHADFRRRSVFASPMVLRTAPALFDAVACTQLQVELLQKFSAGEMAIADLERARDYLLGRAPFWTATAYDVIGPAVALDLLGMPKERLHEDEQRLEALDLAAVPAMVAQHCLGAAPVVVIVGSKETLLGPLAQRFGGATIECRPFTDGLASLP